MDQLHLLEVILDNLPDGVYVLDDRGNYIFVNSAYVQALNMPKDVLLHYNVHDFLNTGRSTSVSRISSTGRSARWSCFRTCWTPKTMAGTPSAR